MQWVLCGGGRSGTFIVYDWATKTLGGQAECKVRELSWNGLAVRRQEVGTRGALEPVTETQDPPHRDQCYHTAMRLISVVWTMSALSARTGKWRSVT